ncbi:alpha/beta fold hydrolase [Jatrophihabitans sp. DSM 45814]
MRSDFSIATGAIAAITNDRWRDAMPIRATALFVPGYTGSKEDFMPLLRPLAAASHRAVAIDQRGQYESSWAKSADGYRIEALALDVVEIAEQLRAGPQPLHLIGHSFGGLVCRTAVLAKPELFDTFTLMDSGPAEISGQRRAALQAAEPVLAEQGLAGLWEHVSLQSQADPKFRQSPKALLDFLRARFLANDPVGLQTMADELRNAPDLTDDLGRLGLPKAVLFGVDDDAWPPEVQSQMAARLGARVFVIQNAAHSPAVENPSATSTALLDFWQHPAESD